MFLLDLSPALFFSFLVTCLIIELTPGPNMAYLAILSTAQGRRAGYFATAGIALGLLVIGVAAALGVASLIAASPVMYQLLRWGGILFLLWLAWEGWQDSTRAPGAEGNQPDAPQKYFVRGLVTNLLNPKAGLFYVAVLPRFAVPEQPLAGQMIVLTLAYVAIATMIHSLIVTLAGSTRQLLSTPHRRMLIGRALSLMLAVVAVWFAVST
jgi:threonine/homoserine/homoserine lactone efflux protein